MKNTISLAPQTGRLIEAVSRLNCIRPFVLVGGTALSIQLHTRLSEDLDFMRWRQGKDDTLDVHWPELRQELETIGQVQDIQVASFDQVLFIVDGVKISFYAAPRQRIPTMHEVPYLNNIRLADVESIGVMKMEAMMRRSKFRDYYDIYSILKSGADIHKLIPMALEHSGHKLKTKGLMSMLTNGELFHKDEAFTLLQPVYDVTASDIEAYIKHLLHP